MKYQFSIPHLRHLGYLTWLVMLIFSVVFYQERAIFMDGAFQLVEIINEKAFKIYHYRLTNPLTQIFAVAAIYLKLPLKWVLVGYSVNFILFFGLIYHLIVHYFKNDFLGWTHILFFILLGLDSFYFLTPEFYQGISLLLLFFAILLYFPNFERFWVLPTLLVLLVPIIFGHKLIAAFFLYLWVFFWLSNATLRQPKYYVLLVAMLVLVAIHSQFFTDWYDTMKQDNMWQNLETYYPNYHLLPANKAFLAKCVKFYYGYPLFLMVGLGGYLAAGFGQLRQFEITFPWLKLVLLVAANLGYLFLIHVGDPVSSYRFYAEVNYLGLSILIMIPVLFDFLPKMKHPKLILAAFFMLTTVRLITIGSNHQTFENRHQWFLQQLEKTEELETNRLLLKQSDAPMDTLIMAWPSPQESLLLAALESAENAKTLLIVEQEKQYLEYLEKDSVFLTSFKKMDLNEINTDYFKLGSSKYQFIK